MFYDFIVSSTDGTKEVFEWVAELWALKSDRRGHESRLCHGLLLVRYWAVVDRIMSPPLPKDVHTLIPEPVKRLLYLARGTLYMWLSKGSENREIFLDYLGGPNVIIRVLKRWKEEAHSQEGAGTTEASEERKAASRSWKRWLNGFTPRPPEEIQPCGHLAFSPVTPIWVFFCPELRGHTVALF